MRTLDLQEFVDEIFEDSKYNEDTKYLFFLGAGCSKSSGIPLAKELAKEWYEKLKQQQSKYKKFNDKNSISDNKPVNFSELYFNIFETLFPTPLSQQREIQRITADRTPSLGYYALAALMQQPSFNTVVTTNFDDLIQDALIYSGHKRALVITHQDLAKFIERNNTPLITKIHGDAHIQPFNNEKGTKEIPEPLKGAIQGLLNNVKIIFIGYGGGDESIADLLSGSNGIDQVYWLNGSKPSGKGVALASWWRKLTTKTYINEFDFDKIMSLIKLKFNLPSPNFDERAKILQKSYNIAENEEMKEIEKIEEKSYTDYMILGHSHFEKGEYDNAIESYKKAIELNPEDDSAYNNIGNCYSNKGEYDNAIASYKKAIELNPESDSAYYNMGCCYDEKGEYNNAIDAYKKAIELNPEKDSAYTGMGNSYIFKNEYDNAIDAYKKAIELNPESDSAYNNIGNSYSNKGEYDNAIASYKKAIELNPEEDFSYLNIFELDLTQNHQINQELEQRYISIFTTDKNSFIQYEMLKIMSEIINDKEVDLKKWIKKYENQNLKDWPFDELDKWVSTKDGDKKAKLLEAMKVFKSKA